MSCSTLQAHRLEIEFIKEIKMRFINLSSHSKEIVPRGSEKHVNSL